VGNDDEKVLSQADVDALVALVPDAPRAAAPPPPPPPPPQAAPPPAPVPPVTVNIRTAPVERPAPPAETARANPPAAHGSSVGSVSLSEILVLKKTVDDLSRQVNKFANTAQRLDALEERIGELAFSLERTSHNVQPAGKEITAIQNELRQLSRLLDDRPHELKDDFLCEHCQAQGTMAVMTKCTSCGREGWFGWWPRKKSR
jgi:hypothetical protein